MASARKELEKVFDEIDSNGNGFIDRKEFTADLAKSGYNLSESEKEALFTYLDESGDGKISKKEFVKAMDESVEPKKHEEAMLRKTFEYFDKDKSGSLDVKEMQEIFKELGEKVDKDQVKKFIEFIDHDKSGTVNYEEFLASFYSCL